MHSKEILELFVVKADKLLVSSFSKEMQKGQRVKVGKEVIDYVGPTDEELDAFLLTHRLFFQKNEPIRINNLHTHYENLGVNESELEQLREIQEWIFNYWHSDSPLVYNKERINNWKFYEAFLYGDLAHTNNAENRKRFKDWTKTTISKESSYFDFRQILGVTLMVIAQLKYLTEGVLLKLDI
ncbi:hypothetical protein [Vibrio ouci]|uniref:Uncharacterized protein n=1 Tax=Vibrio ouci TaxID=2499078 RepID=A0A4Y8W901_9VIBR|nr:hypothetical protein [Vibrio ouci]TFH89389.1 hypothetical protein ELS82_22570 [Vibrio ouci]